MPEDLKETVVEEEEKPYVRRALKACIPCKLGKRKCNHERPCGPCCARGLQSECADEVKEIDPACRMCKKRKLKCDRRRPCGRCFRQGRSADCIAEGEEDGVMVAKRQPDAALEIAQAQVVRTKKQKAVPNAEVLCSGDFSPAESSDGSSNTCSPSPSERSSTSPAHEVIAPENPMAFPAGTINGWCNVIPPMPADNPWPKTLVRMFKTYRTSDKIYQNILNNMPPKLLATVLRIFRAVDGIILRPNAEPSPPDEWSPSSSWHSSLRCGMQAVRVDRNCGVMSGVEVNPFWSDLAGLHREEFVSRSFNGDMNLPTSELRQTCKLIFGVREMIKARVEAVLNQSKSGFEMKPVYGRFSRNWGRGEASDGVLIRMRSVVSYDEERKWMFLAHSIVVVSPEEYEAVRARHPELCEGYLIPVVGSKSAAELMDSNLVEDESFARMSSSEEGRTRLDKLADYMEQQFAFMFDFLAAQRAATAPPMPPAQGVGVSAAPDCVT